jgi:hypothetical protein
MPSSMLPLATAQGSLNRCTVLDRSMTNRMAMALFAPNQTDSPTLASVVAGGMIGASTSLIAPRGAYCASEAAFSAGSERRAGMKVSRSASVSWAARIAACTEASTAGSPAT